MFWKLTFVVCILSRWTCWVATLHCLEALVRCNFCLKICHPNHKVPKCLGINGSTLNLTLQSRRMVSFFLRWLGPSWFISWPNCIETQTSPVRYHLPKLKQSQVLYSGRTSFSTGTVQCQHSHKTWKASCSFLQLGHQKILPQLPAARSPHQGEARTAMMLGSCRRATLVLHVGTQK